MYFWIFQAIVVFLIAGPERMPFEPHTLELYQIPSYPHKIYVIDVADVLQNNEQHEL